MALTKFLSVGEGSKAPIHRWVGRLAFHDRKDRTGNRSKEKAIIP